MDYKLEGVRHRRRPEKTLTEVVVNSTTNQRKLITDTK